MEQDKKMRTKYRTTNWPEYNASLKARGSLTVWLDKEMQWLAQPNGKRGRNQTFSDAAIQFCLSIKCLFGQPLRQSLGMVQSLLKLAHLDCPVPDFSTVSRRQRHLRVQLSYCPSTSPLHLLVDSTGIKFLGDGEWKRKKHGAEYRRQWRKVHLGIDAQTLEIRDIEVTDNSVGDAPMLPELWGRFHWISPWPASAQTGPTTPGRATRPLQSGVLKRSSRHARMRSCGSRNQQGQRCATKRCWPVSAWGAGYGRCGVVTTGAAWWRP